MTIVPDKENPEEVSSSLEDAMNKKADFSGIEGKKVMWVEDDQFLNYIIAKKLSTTKCVVFHAGEGEEAWKIVKKEIPDIVVLDIILPGIDGFEVLRRIKEDPKTKHIPVILLSNLSQQSDIDKGKGLGAARYLVKATVTPNEIMDQIKEVLMLDKK